MSACHLRSGTREVKLARPQCPLLRTTTSAMRAQFGLLNNPVSIIRSAHSLEKSRRDTPQLRSRLRYAKATKRELKTTQDLYSNAGGGKTSRQRCSTLQPTRIATRAKNLCLRICSKPRSANKSINHRYDDLKHGVQVAQPALTRVSHVVRKEALPVFFAVNTFLFCAFSLPMDTAARYVTETFGNLNPYIRHLRKIEVAVWSKRGRNDDVYAINLSAGVVTAISKAVMGRLLPSKAKVLNENQVQELSAYHKRNVLEAQALINSIVKIARSNVALSEANLIELIQICRKE